MTLNEIRQRYGWLVNGLSTDPLISDIKGRNFTLKATSPCIDAGVLVPGINDLRIKGRAPDIGAFENE
jgi:hypothetical protein